MADPDLGRTSGVSFCAGHLELAAFHAVLLGSERKFLLFSNNMKSTSISL